MAKASSEMDTDELMRAERKKYAAELAELDKKRGALAGKLARIDAYFGASGRGKDQRPSVRRRAARGSVQASVLAVIAKAGRDGLKRGEILKKMNLKGDRSAEQSVSNALSALKKASKVDNKQGKYIAA
jgi:hypothetical protein